MSSCQWWASPKSKFAAMIAGKREMLEWGKPCLQAAN
jgi:hypothetical protein